MADVLVSAKGKGHVILFKAIEANEWRKSTVSKRDLLAFTTPDDSSLPQVRFKVDLNDRAREVTVRVDDLSDVVTFE